MSAELLAAWKAVTEDWRLRSGTITPEAMARMSEALTTLTSGPVLRIRAHVVTIDTYRTDVVWTGAFKAMIADTYKGDTGGFTHVDVYSPPECESGERLLYRVKL